jgi:hypothetical protein
MGIVYQDEQVTLEVDGLDASDAPLVLIGSCRRCGVELSRRPFELGPGRPYRELAVVAPEALAALVQQQAEQDAARALLHVCPP